MSILEDIRSWATGRYWGLLGIEAKGMVTFVIGQPRDAQGK